MKVQTNHKTGIFMSWSVFNIYRSRFIDTRLLIFYKQNPPPLPTNTLSPPPYLSFLIIWRTLSVGEGSLSILGNLVCWVPVFNLKTGIYWSDKIHFPMYFLCSDFLTKRSLPSCFVHQWIGFPLQKTQKSKLRLGNTIVMKMLFTYVPFIILH